MTVEEWSLKVFLEHELRMRKEKFVAGDRDDGTNVGLEELHRRHQIVNSKNQGDYQPKVNHGSETALIAADK